MDKETNKLINQLLDEKQALIDNTLIPRDFTSAKECILQLELKNEIEILKAMLNSSNFEELFKSHCATREKDKNWSITFQAMPESLTNQLYWKIAELVFKPKTMHDMLGIILPGIQTHLLADLVIINKPGLGPRELIRNASPTLEPHNLEKFNNKAPSIENFNHFVFNDNFLFDAKEIQRFPLVQHAALQSLLNDKYPEIGLKLYEHNSSLKGLSVDAVTLNNKGITPLSAINQLIQGLILGGNNMTGQGYASKFSTEAVERFFAWFNALPKQVRTDLRALKGGDTNLGRIIDEEILKGQCVETTATNLTRVIQQNKDLPLLTLPPEMRPIDLKTLRDKYGPKQVLDTKKDSQLLSVFPEKLMKEVIERIKPETLDQVISLIVDFPPTFYKDIWKNLKIKDADGFFYRLSKIIKSGFFSLEQKQALAKAIVANYSHFKLEEPLCLWALKCNDPIILHDILHSFTEKQRVAAIQFNKNGYTLLHEALLVHEAAEGLFKVILEALPEELRLEEVQVTKDGRTVLESAVNSPKFIEEILNSLSEAQIAKLGKPALLLAIKANNKILLQKVFQLVIPEELKMAALFEIDEEGDTILHKAAEYPEALKALLEALPQSSRLAAVNVKDKNGRTVLEKTLRNFENPEPLKAILLSLPDIFNTEFDPLFLAVKTCNIEFIQKHVSSIPRDKLFKALANLSFARLLKPLQNPLVIKTLFEPLLSHELFKLVNLLDKNGDTLLHISSEEPESLKMILSLLTLPDRFSALQLVNKEGKMVLHNAGRYCPGIYQSILASFPVDQRAAVAKLVNNRGNTILHSLSNQAYLLTKTIELLPDEERFAAINVPNFEGFTVLDKVKENHDVLIPLVGRLTQEQRNSVIAQVMLQHLKTLKPDSELLESDILNDKKLCETINKVFMEKRLTKELLHDLAILHQFHQEKMADDNNEKYGEDYNLSIDRFYTKALEIRTSGKSIKAQANEIREAAHQEFHPRHETRRLLADALMLVSILFAGLGLVIMAGRYFTNKTVFFSSAITDREEELATRWMKNQNDLPEEDTRDDKIFLFGG
ncbi:MAG: hypothetical protein H0U57_05460 [Tatlockia sp.]|nr:hypothetical protein [Tatlockia sp.]